AKSSGEPCVGWVRTAPCGLAFALGMVVRRAAMNDVTRFNFHVEQENGQELRLRFQEPPVCSRTGQEVAPDSARLLAAAIGTCLADSFFRYLRQCGAHAAGFFAADACVSVVRDEMERLKVGSIAIVFEDVRVDV